VCRKYSLGYYFSKSGKCRVRTKKSPRKGTIQLLVFSRSNGFKYPTDIIVRFWVKERKNVIHVEREERNSKKRRKKEQKQMVEYAIFGT